MNQWIEIQITVNDETEDAIVNHLFELGSLGCRQFEDKVLAYFSAEIPINEISRKLNEYLVELLSLGLNVPHGKLKIRHFAERDWNQLWKRHFKPIVISNKLIIKPTWVTLRQTKGAFVIQIDPKQAFGTGSHVTTQIALQLLEKYLSRNDFVVDVGTGTGILAIAAVKLGARKVMALDRDPVAVEAAKENFEINSTSGLTCLLNGELNGLNPLDPCFDLIVANLNNKEILTLINDIKGLLKNRGYFIISGILEEEQAEVHAALLEQPCFKIVEGVAEEGWIGMVVKKETAI
ncbi:MAG: 50S ribosomal protein L11 methyltransferase [bacterium]